MSPIARGNWGRPETSLGHLANVFDYWSLPRSTLSLYRLSAICQPDVRPSLSSRTPSRLCIADASKSLKTLETDAAVANEFVVGREPIASAGDNIDDHLIATPAANRTPTGRSLSCRRCDGRALPH